MRGDTHRDQKRGRKHVAAYHHCAITVTQHATERATWRRERNDKETREKREKQRKGEEGCWFPCGRMCMSSSKNHLSVRLCRDRLGLRNGGRALIGVDVMMV